MSKERAGRRDITDKVTGRLEDGRLVLYHNHQPVGMMELPGTALMSDGYLFENGRILSDGKHPKTLGTYADDCDTGWC
jgi:hypothetical protein